jgi:hypothetical protein
METRGQVPSREERTALIRAILSLTQAVLSVRSMVFDAKNQNDHLFYENFDRSADAINEVLAQLDKLIETLSQDA